MAPNKKGKKKDKAKEKATPEVTPPIQPRSNETITRCNSKVNFTQDLTCELCNASSDSLTWFILCDDCDKQFHFKCVGITDIRSEDPWSCTECNRKKSELELSSQAVNAAQQVVQGENLQKRSSTPSKQLPINDTLSTNEGPIEQTLPTNVAAVIHNPPEPSIVDLIENDEDRHTDVNQIATISDVVYSPGGDKITATNVNNGKRNLTSTTRHSEIQKVSSTRVPSVITATNKSQSSSTESRPASSRTRSGSAKSKSSSSSYRRNEVELQRAQEELDLQTQIDSETLALKLEALNLKEIRKKRFLEEKFKAMNQSDGSVRSQRSDITSRTSFVTSWIDEQSKIVKARSVDENFRPKVMNQLEFASSLSENIQTQPKAKRLAEIQRSASQRIEKLSFDCSIPIYEDERDLVNKVRKSSNVTKGTIQTSNVKQVKKIGATCTLNENAATYIPSFTSRPSHQEQVQAKLKVNPIRPNEPWSNSLHPQRDQQTVSASVPNCQTTNQIKNAHQHQPGAVPSFEPKSGPLDQVHIPSHNVIASSSSQNQRIDQTRSRFNTTYTHERRPITSTFASSYNTNVKATETNQYTQLMMNHDNQTGTLLPGGISQFEYPHSYYESRHSNYTTAPKVGGEDIWNGTSYSNTQPARQRMPLTANQIAARQAMGKDPLPFFNGNPSDWLQFISSYETSTDNCGFSNVENLRRLEKCLKGNARDIVKYQLTMPECVPEIMDTLRQKFGRPEVIIKSVLAAIRNEPTIKADKLEALSNYGYKVRNVYKTIEALNMNYHLYNPELTQELVDKLPYQTKIDWARHSEHIPQISLKDLSDWLYKLSRSINLVTMPEISSSDRKPEKAESSKSGYVHVHDVAKSSKTSVRVQGCPICAKACKNAGECEKFKSLSLDERWKSIIEHKLCRRCLQIHGRTCKSPQFIACGVSGCQLKHHPSLHNVERHSKANPAKSNVVELERTNSSTINAKSGSSMVKGKFQGTHRIDDNETLFRIVPVVLYNNGHSVKTLAFLDEGSSFTLMEKEIADQLNLKIIPETICLIWTKNVHRQELSENVDLEISGTDDISTRYPLKSVNVVDDLNLPTQTLSPTSLAQRYKHMKNLPLPEVKDETPRILIGLKHVRLCVPLETVEGKEDEPIAARSRIGWSVYGPSHDNEIEGYVNVHRVYRCPCKDRDEDIHKIVKDHFTIENFGVKANSMSSDSKQNEKAMDLLQKFTIRKGNHFETRLLWKNDTYILPDSYPMARKRLTCLENKGANIVNTINDTIKDYLKKGYVSKLTPEEIEKKHPRTFYLPIFTVTNPKKPEKIRPVFDAAATVKGVSLNSALLTGPDLLSPIVDVLGRFREHRIALNGDIKEMYHQVWVNEEDRNSQRFLWRNGNKEMEPEVYVMNVMTFGATCSPCAAQYVKNSNASEFEQKYPRAAKAIIENHYVDDMMDGAEIVERAIELVKEVKFIHSQAGFEIRNFKSNSEKVLKAIGEQVELKKIDLEPDNMKLERVLGMFWDTNRDCFMFSLKYTKVTSDMLTGKRIPTKRELLKLLMSIFDPLGLLSYYLIHAKTLLQDVWRSKIGWDDRLPKQLHENWQRWIELLPNVENLRIPRWYSEKLTPSNPTKTELHIFVDAGGEAFSAVAYLRIEDENGCDCSLIGSKARVTPLKYLSTPRKELMGGVLGSRLVNSVGNSLSIKINRRVIWTDARTLLIWLHSEHRRYSQFVAHRVGEILENTNLKEWRWVPSKSNVADEATKWSKKPTFEITDRWFTGPDFLKLSESEWPVQPTIVPNGTQEEMKLSCTHSQLIIPSIINANDISKWERMHRGLAFAIRFSKIIIAKHKKSQAPKGPLTQEELMESERRLLSQAQWEGFPEEMITLIRNEKANPRQRKSVSKDSSIKDCSPYIDESGILRVEGRIDSAAAVTIDAKRPIILPRNHPITQLIVNRYHRKFGHQNHETVINELKQRFYIPQIRTVLKSVRWSCKLCEIRRCKPRPPKMADLPAIRFETGIRPFTYTDVDYFGPMLVKIGRSQHKRWGVLFTCLTIRAIHIEIAHSLDTKSCIMSIRDFINIRGRPIHFYSDNGSNMKSADSVLRKELEQLDEQLLSIEFTSCYTKWIFNPPASPHMGGCWERLIRTVKSCLKESMTTSTPDDQTLRNLLMESMNVVNSRPLTFIPIESEASEALTPNHFILGTSNGLKPPGKFRNDGPYLRDAWKEVQRCTNEFWQRFIKEYIPTLTRRTKWFEKVKPLEVGDLVINFDQSAFRNSYIRARVVETVVGTKGQVRRAKIQMSDGTTLWRPATSLGLLDVNTSAPTEGSLDRPIDAIETGGRTVGAENSKLNIFTVSKPVAAGTVNEKGKRPKRQATSKQIKSA